MESIRWLGHAGFKVVFNDADGKQRVAYFDAWTDGPTCPQDVELDDADLIFISHGHFDHSSSSPELSKRSKKPDHKVVCIFEVGEWVKSKGVAEGNVL